MAGPFQVIEGGGQPEPVDGVVEALREVLAAAERGEIRGILIVADTLDGDPELTIHSDDPLVMACMAEEVGRQIKCENIGL